MSFELNMPLLNETQSYGTQYTGATAGLGGVSEQNAASRLSPEDMDQAAFSSEVTTFFSEFDKLSAEEQVNVHEYLSEVSSWIDAGNDLEDLELEPPEFVLQMLEQGVGKDVNASGTYQGLRDKSGSKEDAPPPPPPPEEAIAGESVISDRGLKMVEQDDDSSGTAPMGTTSSDAAVVQFMFADTADEDITSIVNEAPAALQALAQDTGSDLQSLLEKYIDAGSTAEAAYTSALNELQSKKGNSDESSNIIGRDHFVDESA